MLAPGLATKITIHLNEDTTARHDFLYNEIFSFLRERGVAGATLMRPAAGFGSHHRTHGAGSGLSEKDHLRCASSSLRPGLLPMLCCRPCVNS